MKKISIIISLFFMALAVGIFCVAWTYPGESNGAPGPGFFPMILSVIVFVLAVLLLLNIRKESGEPVRFFTRKAAAVFLSLVITVLYILLMSVIGFPFSTLLYLFCLMLFFQVKNWKTLIGVPVLTTGIIYGVFTQFLSVQFPQGILF